jgi:inhibitor of cysteine peptidase
MLNKFSFILLILSSFFIASCPSISPVPLFTTKMVASLNEAPIEHIRIMLLESFPIQVNVIVNGNLTDDCTTIDQITETRNGDNIIIKITTIQKFNKICSKTNKLFEEIIPLNISGLLAGIYTVKVNTITTTFELGVDNVYSLRPIQE